VLPCRKLKPASPLFGQSPATHPWVLSDPNLVEAVPFAPEVKRLEINRRRNDIAVASFILSARQFGKRYRRRGPPILRHGDVHLILA
jgi:hypothetical protein